MHKFTVDTTVLLSANEILSATKQGLRVNDSIQVFNTLVSFASNQIDITHLFPGDYNADEIPLAQVLVSDRRDVSYELDGDNVKPLLRKVSEIFVSYVVDNFKLQAWLELQLSDSRYEHTFFEFNEDSRRQNVRDSHEILSSVAGYDKLISYLRSAKFGEFQFYGRHHEEAVRMGMYHYLAAYAYFTFVKGPLYAAQIDQATFENKIDHWLLRDAVSLTFPTASNHEDKYIYSAIFDWGPIFLEILQQSKLNGSEGMFLLQDLICAAKENYSVDVLDDGSAAEIASWVVETLIKAGWKPILSERGKPQLINSIKEMAKLLIKPVDNVKVGDIGIELATIPLKFDTYARSKARQDARSYQYGVPFRNVRADEINKAIRKYIRARDK
jgi:hypothetical protein